jgi:hypothetical protein
MQGCGVQIRRFLCFIVHSSRDAQMQTALSSVTPRTFCAKLCRDFTLPPPRLGLYMAPDAAMRLKALGRRHTAKMFDGDTRTRLRQKIVELGTRAPHFSAVNCRLQESSLHASRCRTADYPRPDRSRDANVYGSSLPAMLEEWYHCKKVSGYPEWTKSGDGL